MRNAIVILLLTVGVGLNGPAWVVSPTKQKVADHENHQAGLVTPSGETASITPACNTVSFSLAGRLFTRRPDDRVAFPRPTTGLPTLQSQHVLLRI